MAPGDARHRARELGSLHPIRRGGPGGRQGGGSLAALAARHGPLVGPFTRRVPPPAGSRAVRRSEEHTSELQSRRDLVCRLLLEKKKKKKKRRKRKKKKKKQNERKKINTKP